MEKQLSQEQIEQYVGRAEDLFRQGFNCAQAVVAACAPLYGVDEQTALRFAASFGGGIGRMHGVCGAASGMFMLEGLSSGSSVAGDTAGKQANYARVRELAARFRDEHGSLICADLLGLPADASAVFPHCAVRMSESGKKPCVAMVGNAVRIFFAKKSVKDLHG